MGFSWTDRMEEVSAQEWDFVLGRSFRPPPFLSRHFLVPWAKTFAAGHRKRAYRWDRSGEPSGFLFLCLCETGKGWEFLGGEQVSDSLDALVVSGREEMDQSPYIPLPSSFGEYLQTLGKKERHELRRKIRKAEETTPGLSFRVTRTREEFERDFPSFLSLHPKSSPH